MSGGRTGSGPRQDDSAMFKINRSYAAPDEFRTMQAAAQRRTDMAWFKSAPGHLSEHGGEEKRIRIAHQRDGSRRVGTELLFETVRRLHAGESAAQDNDPFYHRLSLRRRYGLWAEHAFSDVAQSLGEEAKRRAVQHPADKSWKTFSHQLQAPLRHMTGKQRER